MGKTSRAHKGMRLDIQLLRAVAVGAVLLYHLWPERLPAGYIGVDVFFVISGFLITAHLVRSAESRAGIKLSRFWANRARRLLPLACLVLLATIAAVLAFMPESTWKPSLRNIIGSTLYVQNWLLASDSVNYLARDQGPVPTQHYWSLSVEEQFYVAWPILIVIAIFIALRLRGGADPARRSMLIRRGILAAIVLVFLASFAFSLWATQTSPSTAYFATTTRAWEFAAGGILAFIPQSRAGVEPGRRLMAFRTAASWAGFGTIVAASFLIPAGTPFPGVAAVLPVVGAVLFIWAGDVPRWFAPTVLTRIRPLTYFGDISYGVYLWHWPLIVILPFALGAPLTAVAKIGVIVVAIALAAVSKVLVEDPFRYRTFWTAKTRRGFYPAAVGMLAVCAVSLGSISIIQNAQLASAKPGSTIAPTLGDATDPDASLIPSAANRGDDHDSMYDCFDFDKSGPYQCHYGPDDAPVSIAIVGDSHAAQFIPALIGVVEAKGWRLTTYVGMNCDAGLTENCGGGSRMFADIVDGKYDLVLGSAFRGSSSSEASVADFFSKLKKAGVELLPIADVPFNPKSTYDCIDANSADALEASRCTTPLSAALEDKPDRMSAIADSLGIPYIDLTDVFCSQTVCQSVLGNVIVYQDSPSSHLTSTASRLLVPRLETAISGALEKAE